MIDARIKNYLTKRTFLKLALVFLVSLPVLIFVFKFSLLYRHGIFQGEDWDYFAQSYEAARQSILNYHQFPWWNSWMNGGQPLFANPQFGLFSLQMPLVLLFGTVAGLHISIFFYYILGFWGIYFLLRRLGSKSILITILLSYIWVFSSFSVWHIGGGQLTFAVYLLSPWAFLTLLNIHNKLGWLYFGLVISLLILTAAHYLTLEVLFICAVIAIARSARFIFSQKNRTYKIIKPVLIPYVLSLLLILLLCGPRLLYTFQFTHEYPRFESLDPPVSLELFIASITFRQPVDPTALTQVAKDAVPYGWSEYADYFGLLTIGLFFYLVIQQFEKIKSIRLREWLILISILLAGLLTLGAFASFSPYSLLHNLPIFDQMRVPSRFICWFVLGIIIFLVRLPHKSIIYILLAISVIDVFAASYPVINYGEKPYRQNLKESNKFEQHEFFQTNPNLGQMGIMNIQNLRLLRATQENRGEIYGYEPILNIGEFYFLPGTKRCGINNGCGFVLTKNAIVTRWSPLEIGLRRTAEGPIMLNMNPGKVWYANGKALFPNYKILELQKDFVIKDSSKTINVSFRPVLR